MTKYIITEKELQDFVNGELKTIILNPERNLVMRFVDDVNYESAVVLEKIKEKVNTSDHLNYFRQIYDNLIDEMNKMFTEITCDKCGDCCLEECGTLDDAFGMACVYEWEIVHYPGGSHECYCPNCWANKEEEI